jgi:hypothetical protein
MWERDPTSYDQKADDSLKKLAVYLRNYLPAVERPFLMETEGDVLRATTLYVVHPINLALNAKYRDTPIYCLSEKGVRCDITWKYRNGGRMEAIAVLELKKRGVLRRDDFECAMVDGNRQDKINEAYANMSGADPVATTLQSNAIPVSQQAAAYAIRQETRFVGLFDWQSMFLFYFGELDMDNQEIGDSAYGTWVEDGGTTFFRRSLFGFLDAACEVKIGVGP